MAFIITGLRSMGSGGVLEDGDAREARQVWSYVTNDLAATVTGSGYFNGATSLLAKGDIIHVAFDIDGTPGTNVLVVTSATAAATVTTTGLATVTQTYNARYVLNTDIALTDGASGHIVAPFAGTIAAIYTVLKGGAVATNNAVCTFKIGSTDITNGAVTVTASGSAIGDVDSATPTAANTVAAGNVISCTVSGTPGGSRTAMVSILVNA
jgi:hypothetical protein